MWKRGRTARMRRRVGGRELADLEALCHDIGVGDHDGFRETGSAR